MFASRSIERSSGGDRLADGYQLFGFDPRKQETTCYDLPADLSSCECLDFLSRSVRRAASAARVAA